MLKSKRLFASHGIEKRRIGITLLVLFDLHHALQFAPSITTMQSRPSIKKEGNLLPLRPILFVLVHQQGIFRQRPLGSINAGIQTLSPALGTLIIGAAWQHVCNFAPLVGILADTFSQQLIFFLCPSALAQRRIQRMKPSLSAILVSAAGHAGCNLGPLFRLVAIQLHCQFQEVVFFGRPWCSFSRRSRRPLERFLLR